MPSEPQIPRCPHCGREMQFNARASTQSVKQYLCACTGIVFHKNVVVNFPKPSEKAPWRA